MNTLLEVIRLGRLHFSFGGFLLYSLGALLAAQDGYALSVERFIFGYLILFFAHTSVSYSNDFFDAEEDKRSKPTLFSGGSGVLVKHPGLRPLAKRVAIGLILVSYLLSFTYIYVYSFSPMLLLYVLAGTCVGWFYSAPPLRLSHTLAGNIFFALAVCVLAPGFGNYLSSGSFTSGMLLFFLPLFFYGCAFSIGVEVPDIEWDRMNRKMNYASRYGEKASFEAIAALCLLASLSCLMTNEMSAFFSLAPLAAAAYALLSKNKAATKAAVAVSSIFFFTMLCDTYLFFILFMR